jgi:hypothetical protein
MKVQKIPNTQKMNTNLFNKSFLLSVGPHFGPSLGLEDKPEPGSSFEAGLSHFRSQPFLYRRYLARPVWPCLCPAIAEVEFYCWPCQTPFTTSYVILSHQKSSSLWSEIIKAKGWCHKVEFLLWQTPSLGLFLLGHPTKPCQQDWDSCPFAWTCWQLACIKLHIFWIFITYFIYFSNIIPFLRFPSKTPYPILPSPTSMRLFLHPPTHSLPPSLPPASLFWHSTTLGHWALQDQGPLLPLRSYILCYICGWSHGSLHVYTLVCGLYCCASYGDANPFSSFSPSFNSSIEDTVLSPMVGCEHPLLYLSGSSRASQETAVSGSCE